MLPAASVSTLTGHEVKAAFYIECAGDAFGARCTASSRADYKDVNRQCRAAIRRDHAAYFTDHLREAGPAKMWAVRRPIIGSGRGIAAAPPPAFTPDALNVRDFDPKPRASGTDYVGRRAGAAGDITDSSPAVLSCAFKLQSLTLTAN